MINTNPGTKTYVVGYETGFLFLLVNADGDFAPIEDLTELWLIQQVQNFESAEALALEHNATVFEVREENQQVVLIRWESSHD